MTETPLYPLSEFTPEQVAKVAEFDAAPTLPEAYQPTPLVALLDQLDAAREAAYDEVVRLCQAPGARWTMSIPARPTVDSDLLIAKALDDHKRLTAAVRAVLELADELERVPADMTLFAGDTARLVRKALGSVTP